jgi:3-oxoacyl-[acyl-carrier protein] reductase
MEIRFDQKTVVVSGAAHGIGRRIAERFSALGAKVFVCDILREKLLVYAGTGIVAEVVDLRDTGMALAWISRIEQQTGGAIDILVNNAGGPSGVRRRAIEEVSEDEWHLVFANNVDAAFSLIRAVVPSMKRRGAGRIVNISSTAGLGISRTGIQAYASAKHALIGLTRQIAHELGPYGITVNSIAPGVVPTWSTLEVEEERNLITTIPMRRLGTTEDIANAVLFISSAFASWVSGQVLVVNGGK